MSRIGKPLGTESKLALSRGWVDEVNEQLMDTRFLPRVMKMLWN